MTRHSLIFATLGLSLSSVAHGQDTAADEVAANETADDSTYTTTGKSLTAGEFYNGSFGLNNARTLEKGEMTYHPLFQRSAVGLSDNMDIRFGTLGFLVGGPQLGLEYAIVQNDSMALSLEPSMASNWAFDTVAISVAMHYTQNVGDNRFNVSVHSPLGIPTMSLGYDLVVSERTIFTFGSHVGIGAIVNAAGIYAVPQFAWNHAMGKNFRMALGVNLYMGGVGGELGQAFETLGIDLPELAVVPLPTYQMWWKF
jgi:hypothetical protein